MKLLLLRLALLMYLFTLSFAVGRVSALLRLPSPLAKLAAVHTAISKANIVAPPSLAKAR